MSDRLLSAVQAIAISPEDAEKLVRGFEKKERRSGTDSSQIPDAVADRIIARYAKLAAGVGGASGLAGIIPGVGTAAAALGGTAADMAASVKLQVDMVMCLTCAYGHDIHSEEARHLAFLLSAGSALEHAGERFAVDLASKAGVKLLRQYLKGAVLQTLKELFKKLGLAFTRKALEKALPFGIGVVLGGTFNYAMTSYVGATAKSWFKHEAGC